MTGHQTGYGLIGIHLGGEQKKEAQDPAEEDNEKEEKPGFDFRGRHRGNKSFR
jgi:hypothetical protein